MEQAAQASQSPQLAQPAQVGVQVGYKPNERPVKTAPEPTSLWVKTHPGVLVGLQPSLAYWFANNAINGNDMDDIHSDYRLRAPNLQRTASPYISNYASDNGRVARLVDKPILTDKYQAAYMDATEAANPFDDIGKGETLKQGYDTYSMLSRPVQPNLVLGVKALPTDERVITAAATFEDAYFLEVGLIRNQPMLLDVYARKTDANGQASVANIWSQVIREYETPTDVKNLLNEAAGKFVYGRLVAIEGDDILRNSFSMSNLPPKTGVPYGPPSAIIPTMVLFTSLGVSIGEKNIVDHVWDIQLIVEEFLNKMLKQHPMLCNVVFNSAVFEVAVGIPGGGVEIITVTLNQNRAQPTAAEKAAFDKRFGSLGNTKSKPAEEAKPAKKSDSLSQIVQAPYILGLDQEFNTAPEKSSRPAPVVTMTEEQLAGAALAKMYSDGLYVATIIYKKSFDLEDENPGLTAMYKEWINGAAPSACGTYSPLSTRKISLSSVRADFANGRLPSIIGGIKDYADGVDTFLSLKLMPIFDNYDPISGRFNYYTDSIATGHRGEWSLMGGKRDPPLPAGYRQRAVVPQAPLVPTSAPAPSQSPFVAPSAPPSSQPRTGVVASTLDRIANALGVSNNPNNVNPSGIGGSSPGLGTGASSRQTSPAAAPASAGPSRFAPLETGPSRPRSLGTLNATRAASPVAAPSAGPFNEVPASMGRRTRERIEELQQELVALSKPGYDQNDPNVIRNKERIQRQIDNLQRPREPEVPVQPDTAVQDLIQFGP